MGPPKQYRAELTPGDARAAAWATAVDFYAGLRELPHQLRTPRDQGLPPAADRRLRTPAAVFSRL